MSSGKQHDKATRKLSLLLLTMAGLSYPVAGSIALAMLFGWGAAGAYAGLWVNPDLDLKGNARARWRKLGLGWLWIPYDRLIRHRSPLSHGPIIGTAGRLAYLALAGAIAFVSVSFALKLSGASSDDIGSGGGGGEEVLDSLIGLHGAFASDIGAMALQCIFGFVVGLAMSDILHLIMDTLSSRSNRNRRR